jgi:acetoin utilization deacetylase AcuC-like enzyme
MNKTGIVRDNRFLDHVMDPGHPESPERLRAIYKMLDESEIKKNLQLIQPRPATRSELEMVHSPSYIEMVSQTAGKPYYRLDMDTSTCAKSYETALLAAGGFLELIQSILEGKLDNGFALIRPPGHHAERDRAMGFCIFNNVAIGASYALKNFSLERILIVDWDVHHGNGTQNSFYEDPRVLYFSTHRYGFFYPGTGASTEVGKGKGLGFNLNVPLSMRAGDPEYGNIFEKILKPIALEYKPQLILVSAGFDIHYNDPLGGMEVTEKGFSRMTQIIMDIARETSQGKLAFTLEGGYDVMGQSRSVEAVLKELIQDTPDEKSELIENEKKYYSRIERLILQVKEIQRRYWKTI